MGLNHGAAFTLFSCLLFHLGRIGHCEEKNCAVDISKRKQDTPSDLLDSMLCDYDHRIRPNFEGEPVIVTCEMFVKSIGSIEERTMDYSVNIFLRQKWNDPRLAFTKYNHTIAVDVSLLKQLWQPDLFFVNEKSAKFHSVTVDNKFLRISPNGDILYSSRLTLQLACEMNLEKFPLDYQRCDIQMESYGFTTENLILQWKEDNPVQLGNSELSKFNIIGVDTIDCPQNYTTGTYTCIAVQFHLQRKIGYYLIQLYIPSILIVIISWISFWITMESAPARTALGITTVLTMTTQSTSSRASMPEVSYIRSIDIWMAVCQMFVFAALLEFAAVNFLGRQDKHLLRSLKIRRNKTNAKADEAETQAAEKYKKLAGQYGMGSASSKVLENDHAKAAKNKKKDIAAVFLSRAKWIDMISRFAFPIAFLVFNVLYWGTYLATFDERGSPGDML
ncbi:glycine receptor subunit alpha-3-like [Branchiostoma floridae]|uniref:Glycine receptor subunit alpha-3-like n=1 Tax=Branchiostoma floridae TaxID=7739 RepID=A0A9J7M8A5_BRAFL|nr:glycine receptor subunit alpha-3-like [Branchiostoma floridae]